MTRGQTRLKNDRFRYEERRVKTIIGNYENGLRTIMAGGQREGRTTWVGNGRAKPAASREGEFEEVRNPAESQHRPHQRGNQPLVRLVDNARVD